MNHSQHLYCTVSGIPCVPSSEREPVSYLLHVSVAVIDPFAIANHICRIVCRKTCVPSCMVLNIDAGLLGVLCNDSTDSSWRESEENGKGKTPLVSFSPPPPPPSVCVFSGASCLQRRLIGYPLAIFHWFSLFLGRRNRSAALWGSGRVPFDSLHV